MEKQEFLDKVAMDIFARYAMSSEAHMQNEYNRDRLTHMARTAYLVAECLWKERQSVMEKRNER